jgi:hypothetical protein
MATISAAILNDFSNTTLGSAPMQVWDAMFRLAGASAIGSTSGKKYTEFAAYLDATLGANHLMTKQYRTQFSGQLSNEARS